MPYRNAALDGSLKSVVTRMFLIAITPTPLRNRGRRREIELLHSVVNLVAFDAEELRCARLIPGTALQRLQDECPLDIFQVDALWRQLKFLRAVVSGGQWEVRRFQNLAVGQ